MFTSLRDVLHVMIMCLGLSALVLVLFHFFHTLLQLIIGDLHDSREKGDSGEDRFR